MGRNVFLLLFPVSVFYSKILVIFFSSVITCYFFYRSLSILRIPGTEQVSWSLTSRLFDQCHSYRRPSLYQWVHQTLLYIYYYIYIYYYRLEKGMRWWVWHRCDDQRIGVKKVKTCWSGAWLKEVKFQYKGKGKVWETTCWYHMQPGMTIGWYDF